MKVSQNISKRLDGILFGFFKAEEIRKMSVVEITCLSAFDQFNNPLKGGLYDPAMGVSPYERFAKYSQSLKIGA
jgi:DNA-directed RNA polymerase I subunit RPA1